MRARASTLTALLAATVALASCGGGGAKEATTAAAPRAELTVSIVTDSTAARLETALITNPNNAARDVRCRRATAADRRIAIASFGGHPRHLFTCTLTVGALPPATYDFMLIGGCFVGHRRGANAADYGCLRRG
ncbi:MAG TPA: hypothetical protein VI318_17935 [Baekduia sp.]